MTNLITLNAQARNTIEPTTVLGASSINAKRYGISLDYELLRRLILSVSVLSTDDTFEGLGREDSVFGSGLSAKFMVNRNLYAYVGYNTESREVTPQEFGEENYDLRTVFIRLQGQL